MGTFLGLQFTGNLAKLPDSPQFRLMAHIAVNTRLLLPQRLEGISRFAYELLRRLAARHPEVQFTYFFDRPYDPAYLSSPNIRAERLFPPARHPLLWHAWFHGRLRQRLTQLRPDVHYSPEFYLGLHPQVPEVATFHDLAYEHFPDDLSRWASHYCRKYSPRYARHANQIVTVSEFTKQDIVSRYGVAAEKISVVPNSAGDQFHPIPATEAEQVRHRYASGQPYFHFVGTIQPRKNLVNLLLAFDRFKTNTGMPHQLLLIGRPGWNYDAALQTYEGLRHRDAVHFTGYVPDGDLNRLYAASDALVYVPWLEGFGIPVVEAFHAEVPVITSNRSSLPEVAGEAALLVDPADPAAIAQAMTGVAGVSGVREDLIAAGRRQRQQFSWDRSADALWEVLRTYF